MKKPYKRRLATPRPAPTATPRTNLNRAGAFLVLLLSLALGARAQPRPAANFFRADGAARAAVPAATWAAVPSAQALTLDLAGLTAALATAPLETRAGAAPLVLVLPLPNGRSARFAVREAPIMAPALAARFPLIRTYAGVGFDDATASVRLDVSPRGFHAQVLAGAGASFYIDPASPTDARHCLSFYKKDMNRAVAAARGTCGFAPDAAALQAATQRRLARAAGGAAVAVSSGPILKTYRLALACTPEYALVKGNTVASVLAGEVATVNRVVGVYERELAVRLVLVPNNDQLVFLSGTGPQPLPAYTNDDGGEMLGQNQTNVDRVIGLANYDIGHVFSTGGGGVALLGSVCTASKAGGVTGQPNPVGDAFDIDFVAHEMGHQFGGNHPFNGNGGSCAGGNRNPITAWEPGSGTTIMAYAGICGSANDLQPNSDATFHTGTFEEMRIFIEGTTCGTDQATGNTAPVVTAPASGRTLPVGTPFRLTATATDAENDALTYSWEELDLGPTGPPTAAQVPGRSVPLFRSFNPTANSTRTFPRLADLVANTTVIGERLPTVTRGLRFRCTARDEHPGPAGMVGGVNYSSLVTLDVRSTAGPFLVTAPNTAVTWTGGAAQTVAWDVAGTANAPVSCALVNLRLSLDGGLTYPTLLAANEPNDGSAVVTAPSLAAVTTARVMVEAADNYFFDISDANFTIAPPTGAPVITSFTPTGGLAGTVVTVRGGNFTGATAVRFNGATAAGFTVNSATQLTATVAAGTTTGLITVTTPAGTATSAAPFVVGAPPVITSFAPATGGAGASVVITGTDFTGATQVTFSNTVAPAFVVNSATQITVTVPVGATTGPLAVTTPVSTGVSATSFVVIPPPFVTAFTPTAGAAGTVVVLTGDFFTGATQVAFNGTAAPVFAVNSATQITVTVPAGATSGLIAVTALGGVGTSLVPFTVPPPNDQCAAAIALACGQTVTGSTEDATAVGDPFGSCNTSVDGGGVFYAITGTGTNITVSTCNSGTNFDTKLFVYSGACGTYTCVRGNDDVSCSANSTSSAVTFSSVAGTVYRIFVSGFEGETGSFALSATCAPPAPVVASLSPASGAAGTLVTLTGTDFTGATALALNGVAVPGFTVVNATTITFTVPGGATTGNVVVTTSGGASPAAAGNLFTVLVVTATAAANRSEFSVWPNPVAGKGLLRVTLATPAAQANLALRNVLGQLVSTRAFRGSTTELSTAGLATGTYLLSVQVAGRAPSVQRVVVE
ncbi:reprolysin-like metallopeptidase [Hymenobacter sp.]|uniref:reprolysin-like metallopeptidase n=1 Tax=Hymenobacter sp. TaxID=1898978 RepID=UPI00286A4FF6|nr:zinc-dependent metalloprotease family protein [Hymenobacter sp.]